ncbi:hypothetical protein HDU93_001148 [Gonapodya sp. JEL0774]|nr:hypothetical protein HDU93_001148 [Gonapodya sp. JEL0774]
MVGPNIREELEETRGWLERKKDDLQQCENDADAEAGGNTMTKAYLSGLTLDALHDLREHHEKFRGLVAEMKGKRASFGNATVFLQTRCGEVLAEVVGVGGGGGMGADVAALASANLLGRFENEITEIAKDLREVLDKASKRKYYNYECRADLESEMCRRDGGVRKRNGVDPDRNVKRRRLV